MKLVKLSALLMLLVVFSSFVMPRSQDPDPGVNGYYLSYADYKAKKLQKTDGLKAWMHVGFRAFIVFKKDGKTETIKCLDMWGFMYKDQLFRIDHNKTSDDPCAVMSTGKIVYYENGSLRIDALQRDVPYGRDINFGRPRYFSKDINSEMISVSNKKEYRKFKEDNLTKYKSLFDCLDKLPDLVVSYLDCVKEFNEGKKAIKEK